MEDVTLTLSISFDMDQFGDSLCAFSQVCDCTVHFTGSGAFVEGKTNRGTFQGSWAVSDTDCSAASGLSQAIWTAGAAPAYHTFRWSADGTRLDEWIAHQQLEDITPFEEDQNDNGQFWISGMRAGYPGLGGPVSYAETKVDLADLIYITTVFTFEATFR